MSKVSILLAAIEPSGDALGAALFRALRKARPDDLFFGAGGEKMRAEGFQSLFATEKLAVMGFTDVAKALPEGFKRAKELALVAAEQKAKAAILIDGWAFSRLVAKRLRQYSPETKVYKLAGPQVWASRPQRVHFVKEYFDGVLTLLPFEPKYFETVGIPSKFIGNPTFQNAAQNRGIGDRFRKKYNLQGKKILAVLPGSRKGEIDQLLPIFSEVVSQLAIGDPSLSFVAPLAPAVSDRARAIMQTWDTPIIFSSDDEKYDVFAAADVALAASGTVSTELAINATPMVITYKVDPLTAFWARRVKTTPYGSILNVLADAPVIPEFFQERCTPAHLTKEVAMFMRDKNAAAAQRSALEPLLAKLRLNGPDAGIAAADQIIEWLDREIRSD